MEKIRPTKSYKGSDKPHTIKANGEKVVVSTEVHLGYNRPNWAAKKQQSRERRCIDETTGKRCAKPSCYECDVERAALGLEPKEKTSPQISYEQYVEDGFEIAAPQTTEEIAAYNLLRDAFEAAIADFDSDVQEILRLAVDEWPERDIKDELGCTLYKVNSTKKKFMPIVRERLAGWRDGAF